MVNTVKKGIAKNCKIPNVFSVFSNINKKLETFSIRDLKKLADFDTRGKIKKESFIYNKIRFSTALPLFNLVSYMVEVGMSVNDIRHDLLAKTTISHDGLQDTRSIEYIRLIYPIFVIENDDQLEFLKNLNHIFRVETDIENGVISSINVEKANS